METKTRTPAIAPPALEPSAQEGGSHQTAEALGESAGRSLRKARREAGRRLSQSEEWIRNHPAESAFAALGAGFLLAQFPLHRPLAAIFKLALLILKPLALIYGLVRMTEELRAAPDRSSSPLPQAPPMP